MPAGADRAVFLAYVWGARAARLVPSFAGRPLARLAGQALVPILGRRRAQVERNLVRILGPLPAAELAARTRATFENYARYWYELFRLAHEPSESLLARIDAEGLEHLEAARAQGRGVIGVVPHLGGYDIAAAWFAASGIPFTVVVEPLEPPELAEWFIERRGSAGMEVVPLGDDAPVRLTRALAQERVVVLVADRDLTGDGVEVELFGERTTMPGGPALLALRTGAPLLSAASYFGGGDRHRVVIEEPIPVAREGRLRDDVARVTAAVARRFERLVRAAPEQWFVLQPNWPSDRDPEERDDVVEQGAGVGG